MKKHIFSFPHLEAKTESAAVTPLPLSALWSWTSMYFSYL